MRFLLDRMADHLVARALAAHADIQEGEVLTVGPPAYRRLDCDGRALAYIRTRPRRAAVRVDLSGLWIPPSSNPLTVASATGAAFMLRAYPDIDIALAALVESIESTRAVEGRAA
jgi:hypothetical protein